MATRPTKSIKCGNCEQGVAAEIVWTSDLLRNDEKINVYWLRCPACQDGSVINAAGSVWPTAPAGGSVANLPTDVGQAWREARATHSAAAYTASEMMCRKILMHLAVDKAGSKVGGTFKQFIEDLDVAGFIGPALRPSIEKVKDRGNTANHDLPASKEDESLVTLKITEHLLRGVYEIPAL